VIIAAQAGHKKKGLGQGSQEYSKEDVMPVGGICVKAGRKKKSHSFGDEKINWKSNRG